MSVFSKFIPDTSDHQSQIGDTPQSKCLRPLAGELFSSDAIFDRIAGLENWECEALDNGSNYQKNREFVSGIVHRCRRDLQTPVLVSGG